MFNKTKDTKETDKKNKKDEVENIKGKKKAKSKDNKNKYKFMDEVIGITDITDKYVETKEGYNVIISVSSQDISILNEDEQNAFEDTIISLMLSLNFPIKYRRTSKKIQLTDFKQLIAKHENKNEPDSLKEYRKKLLNKIEEIENDRDIYTRQNYIIISTNKINNDKDRSLKNLEARYTTVIEALRIGGIKTTFLNKYEIYQVFYDIFNKNSNLQIMDLIDNGSLSLYCEGKGTLYKMDDTEDNIKVPEDIGIQEEERSKDSDIFVNGVTNIKEILKPDIFDVKDDYIYMGPKKYCRMYSIATLPRNVNITIFDEFFNLGLIDITTYIENIPDASVTKRISQKYSKIKSQLNIKEKNGEIIDYDEQLAAQHLDNLRELIQTNADRMFYSLTLFTVWAENLDKLEYKCTIFEDTCARKGIKQRVLVKDQKEAFITALPLSKTTFRENLRNVTSGSGAAFFPIGNTDLCHKYGIYYGRNLITKSPICYDSLLNVRNSANSNELTNPHVFFCGKSGSGKSTTLKVITARKLTAGHWIIILDPEKEYEKMVEEFGGKYITLKAGRKSGINPFELEVEEDNGKKYVDIYGKLAEIRSIINAFVKNYTGDMMKATELTALERAINKVFYDKGITKDPESLYEEQDLGIGKVKKKMPTLSDLRNALAEDNKYTKDLVELMTMITGDGSMNMFDCETDPALDVENNRLIGVNLKELDEFSQMYAMSNALSWIWGKFSNYKYKNIDKDAVVDEGWTFAKRNETEILEHIARRGRKYHISLNLATQMIEEFLGTTGGKAIIQQCATKIIMRQDPSVAREIIKFFNLSSNSQSYVSSFDKGCGLLVTEREQLLMQVELFDFEKSFALT